MDFQLSALGHCVLYHFLFPFITPPPLHCTCSVILLNVCADILMFCTHTYVHKFIQKHTCKLYCVLFCSYLIPVDSHGLKGTTLLPSCNKLVCFLANSLYQLIETVKRVSLRGLVTQSCPNACQHCHLTCLSSGLRVFPFLEKEQGRE